MKFFAPTKISENIRETPEGFLLCIAVPIARTGEMVYGKGETPLEPDGEGKVIIYREAEEVFKPETLASFEGKALTITHPDEFVNPVNWKHLAKGILQNIRRGEGDQKDDVIADILITDSVAISLVKNGLREVSCGYEAEYIEIEKGKGKQTNIIGNHLALVEQGRAGSNYAINDHKGKERSMKLQDKIKAIFAKAQDEALKMADETPPEDKDKKEKSADASAYDELCKMVKDLVGKVDAMAKPKDEQSKEEGDKPAGEKKADDADVNSSLEDRLKSLEAQVAKLLDLEASEQTGDEDEEEETDDDDFEESTMTGDSAITDDIVARAEILAPGIKRTKDVKVQALKTAYATKDGKKIIDSITGSKPKFDDEARVNTIFLAASELLKVHRNSALASTKKTKDNGGSLSIELGDNSSEVMTPEKINEINAKYWEQKQKQA